MTVDFVEPQKDTNNHGLPVNLSCTALASLSNANNKAKPPHDPQVAGHLIARKSRSLPISGSLALSYFLFSL